ncbi:proteasome regulatory particle base subunit, partial [Tulasnella sp. 427]
MQTSADLIQGANHDVDSNEGGNDDEEMAGTGSDVSLPKNLNWHALANNWAKPSATASLGVINKGTICNGDAVTQTLPPKRRWGRKAAMFIRKVVRRASSEVAQHGAAPGLGVAEMASGIGVAFTSSRRKEEAGNLVEQHRADKDSILRYGGDYTLALAYAGTVDSAAVKKLPHIAVFDTSEDVGRAAVTCNRGQVPRLVQLLSKSYNPCVLSGVTLALGLSCAGTGSPEAMALLEPMSKDPPKRARASLAPTRTTFAEIVADKHEDPMARSLFAYPAATKPSTKEAIQKVETDALSTTVKDRARGREEDKAKAAEAGEVMETDEKKTEPKPKNDDTSMKVDMADAKPAKEGAPAAIKPKKQREPSSEKLSNRFPSRGTVPAHETRSRIVAIDEKGPKEGSYTALGGWESGTQSAPESYPVGSSFPSPPTTENPGDPSITQVDFDMGSYSEPTGLSAHPGLSSPPPDETNDSSTPTKHHPAGHLVSLDNLRIAKSRIRRLDGASEVKSGGYGDVELAILDAEQPDGGRPASEGVNHVAVKKIRYGTDDDDDRVLARFTREIKLVSDLDDENIVKIIGFVEHFEEGVLWMVFPWEKNGNLREFVRSANWELPERISL